MALTYDGDVQMAIGTLAKLNNLYRPQSSCHHTRISRDQVEILKCPPDGNCLFSALYTARSFVTTGAVLSYSDRGEAGKRLREKFLEWAKKAMEEEQTLPGADGISVKTLLIDSQRWHGVEEYIEGMKPPITSRRQWGLGRIIVHSIFQ